MAYYENDDEQQLDPNAQAQQGTGPESAIISGQGAATQGGAATRANPTPDNPGNFVGIKQYLDANKVQSSKLGNQVAGAVSSDVNQAQQAIEQAGDQFKQQASTVPNSQDTINQANTTIQNAGSTPLSQDDITKFRNDANTQYTGPADLTQIDSYAPTVAAVNKGKQSAQLAGSESGQQQLLARQFGNAAQYKAGEKRLDSYLLNSEENRNKLSQAAAPAQNFQSDLDKAVANSANFAGTQRSEADKIRQAIAAALGGFGNDNTSGSGALGNYQSDLVSKLGRVDDPSTKNIDEGTGILGDQEKLLARIKSGKATQADLQKYNITADMLGTNAYGVQLGNYFNSPVATMAGITSADDKAKYDSLLQLAGIAGDPIYGGDAEAIGSYNGPQFDKTRYDKAVEDQKVAYSKDMDNIANSINKEFLNLGGNAFGEFHLTGGNVQDILNQLNWWINYKEGVNDRGPLTQQQRELFNGRRKVWAAATKAALIKKLNDAANSKYGQKNPWS